MEIKEYFSSIGKDFDRAYEVAKKARALNMDPKNYVEIKPAPDLPSRVEGLMNVNGIAERIRGLSKGQSRNKLAFNVVDEICKSPDFDGYETVKRIDLAVRVGTAILTEGILVAPTEGISGVRRYKNADGSDYLAVSYAGPIRGAGGTAAALSVALADYARKIFKIDIYKPSADEIERYVEEAELYHTRAARLQYKPSDDDIRTIVGNCPICIDGVPTETIEVSVHGNLKRLGPDGKEILITNRVRGGIALVVCEGIAQKAKKIVKETKSVGLDWEWLNKVIKVEIKKVEPTKSDSSFLEELVAGRPILSYPNYYGGFRLRYGRSRFTGIAAKGFNPATMITLDGFIAVGTQLKMESPGKGCIAMPVDTIEGPFVKLKSGECLRLNNSEMAMKFKDQISEIIALGDILIAYGDFKKPNSLLKPSSYVEELWSLQLKNSGYEKEVDHVGIGFREAYEISMAQGIPIHPKFLYEFQAIKTDALARLSAALLRGSKTGGELLFDLEALSIESDPEVKRALELINVPHRIGEDGRIVIDGEHAQALSAQMGFVSKPGNRLKFEEKKYDMGTEDALAAVNAFSPFQVPKKSTYIAARVGRPEKAKERLMKPAPNVLFPISEYGGKERSIASAYAYGSRRFNAEMVLEIARYKCRTCRKILPSNYCYECRMPGFVERYCPNCNSASLEKICVRCGKETVGYEKRNVNIVKLVTAALGMIGENKLPQVIKGVKGLTNVDKNVEPLEKGILRGNRGIYIFKDGTSRFDATDVPITHFYPMEIGVSVERLRQLGYTKDYMGNELTDDTQLVELMHQDVILNRRGADYMLRVALFIDDLLAKFYKLPPFYNAAEVNDMVGKLVITLSPHTSCGVLNRIIGFTDASVGFAHPYIISARRRNCDGDEDTTMLLLDALINFSRDYLPNTVGGTMDTPLILTINVNPQEVDDEVHAMEVVTAYNMDFYNRTFESAPPSEVKLELVENRLGTDSVYSNIGFTHQSSWHSVADSPKHSTYTQLKTMQQKLDAEFLLIDKIDAVNKRDVAKKVIMSHFIPDLIGNLHSFSKQIFRCSNCNSKYRRMPLIGKCARCGGKLLLTISKGSIEKYLAVAIALAERYSLEDYIRQRLYLIKEEIDAIFMDAKAQADSATEGQFSLLKYV
ncbi:MAG: DNA polymerase II large subunit [Candidatus Micrarchaeota archaeon]|nr:DNA polymerase II large subunit [Candidatus Micrarchaeota archaeon]